MVAEASTAGNALGLTKSDIKDAAESRLRGARLYTNKLAAPYLRITITILKSAYSVDLRLIKAVSEDRYSQVHGFAATWIDKHTGSHSGGFAGGSFILSGLSRLLERFIADYLRVNESACSGRLPLDGK
ncbi:MAG: hypothetical protein OXI53_07080 [Nitrospira sp.]|nr:hypothetical protein [Nitrospira sp.]